jgi:N-acetylneuraminic acid mutarotase
LILRRFRNASVSVTGFRFTRLQQAKFGKIKPALRRNSDSTQRFTTWRTAMRIPSFLSAGVTPDLPCTLRTRVRTSIPGLISLAVLLLAVLALPMGMAAQSGHPTPAIAKPEVQPMAPADWIWWDGSSTVGTACVGSYPCGQVGVYGTKGTVAVGNNPGSRSDAMSWTDTSGRKWLFGGFGYGAGGGLGEQNDLWQSNALGNSWGWISGSNGPGHSGVYGTLGATAASSVPGGREGGATWTDKNGNLWLFGGLGYDGSGTNTYGYENDLWMYNTTTNEWTWESGSSTVPAPESTIYGTLIGQSSGVYGTLGTPASGNTPSGRTNATAWTDSNGNLWLFGGGVVDELGYEDVYNDLWEFNTTTKEWVWVGGGNTLDELGVYGTLGTAASGNAPGARFLASGWTDSSGNFWLFGGSGYASNAGELNLNDLWKFSPSSNQWTWMGGGSVLYPCNILFSTPCPFPGTYGTLGVAASTNFPGARNAAPTWTDSSGNLWLFGGAGQDANNYGAWLNDLWEYNPTTTFWTWMGGSSTVPASCVSGGTGNCGQPGVYGSEGAATATSVPGARQTAVAWTDQSGNFWLFGGWGVDENGATGYLNDMWEYQPQEGTVTPQAAVPAFSVATGTYATAQSVTITDSTPNPTIYYTTNGTTPTTSSTVYNGMAITVSSTETIEAIATASGYTQSATASATYTITAATAPTVTVTPSPASITTAQSLSVTVTVSGTPTPTGSVVLTSGSYTSAAATLSGGSATINVPAGSLAKGTDTLTATYTPDAASSSTYTSAMGSNTETVTAAATAPTVTVTPSPSSITTAQSLSVTVTVSGTPTPTGSVVLTSGSYTSAAATLTAGTATINVPAGSLGKGTDTLTATYTPDAASSSTYTSAVGTNTETVTAAATAPTVTVTPSPASITTAQALSVTVTVSGTPTPTGSIVLTSGSYTSGAVTLSGGSAAINVPAGSLPKGTDMLTATYTPDAASSSTYTNATGSNTETVTSPALITPTVAVTPSLSSITTAQGLSVTVTVSGTPTPTGSVVLSGGGYTSAAVTLSAGTAAFNIPAGSLAVATDTLIATYTPDAASSSIYNSTTGSNTVTVTAAITAVTPTVTVTPASSSITTAQSLSVAISLGGTECAAVRRKIIGLVARTETCTATSPTGSVVLSGGGYTSASITLTNGGATITIPAGALTMGTDTLTATYTPDANSSSIYTSATGTSTVTVTAAITTVAPTVTVTAASSSITTAQSLSVAISVSNSSPCTDVRRRALSVRATPEVGCASIMPTGSVTLTGGGYTSASVTLTSGSATISIPAGSLTTGTDTLTATYTPDSNSSSTFASATGTSTVTVTAVVVAAPVASLTPPSLTFTALSGATSAAQTATLTNTGNAALSITSIAIAGTNAADFAQTNTCGESLAAGANCTISVTFSPASAASLSATLSVTDNATGSPQSVTLGGTGTPLPSFTLVSGSPSGSASQTTAATYAITITPQNGSFTSPITFTTSGLPAGYLATFNPATVTPGSSPAITTMTIRNSTITASQTLPLAAPLLAFLGFCFLPDKRRRRLLAMCLLTVASLGGLATLTGCGGGFALLKPAQSYTVTITASGGGQTQTTTVLLTVQE